MTGSEPEFHLPLPMPLDGHAGPAPRLPAERSSAMLGAALLEFDRVHASPGSPGSPGAAKSAKSLWAAPKTWAVAASGLLALAGGAAAARYYFHAAEPAATRAPVVQAPAPAPALSAAQPPAAVEATPQPAQVAPQELQPSADSAAPAAFKSAVREPERSRAAVRGAPEDLLQKANHQRALGQFRDASQTYALVYERFPRSVSAYVARVAAGAIELEHLSNPTRARKLFEQALREQPRGALDLEARQGLSVALRDLEDRTGEREVLRALIAEHSDSPAARRAQVRLRELASGGAGE